MQLLFVMLSLGGLVLLWKSGSITPGDEPEAPSTARRKVSNTEWIEPMLVVGPGHYVPRFRLLAYREGLLAGFTWLYGLPARAVNGTDRKLGSEFKLTTRTGEKIPLKLVFFEREDGAVEAELTGPRGTAVIHTFHDAPERGPLDRAAELALVDLERAAQIAGLKAPMLPPGIPAELPAWSPAGLKELATALEPLARPASKADAAHLARAGRAMAWQAFMDSELAPAIAPQRAAQALALASVAERLAGAPIPDCLAASWLAPAAAVGDLWMLARQPPPADAPELTWLHRVYRESDLPETRPDGWSFAAFVSLTARAREIDEPGYGKVLATWASKEPWAGPASVYLAQSRWSSELTTAAAACVLLPARELEAVSKGWTTELPAQFGDYLTHARAEVAKGNPGAARLSDGLVDAVEALLESAGTRPYWQRVLLEETAERMLHGAAPLRRMYEETGSTEALKAQAAALLPHAKWEHPELQWQLTSPSLTGKQKMEPSNRSLVLAASGACSAPRLLQDDPQERLGDSSSEVTGHLLCWWRDYPGVIQQSAWLLLADKARTRGAAMLDHLFRTEGPDRLPHYGWTNRSAPPFHRDVRLQRAPAGWNHLPDVALARANLSLGTDRVNEALAALARAAARNKTHPGIAKKRIEIAFRTGKAEDALAVAEEYLKAGPAPANAASICTELAEQLRDAGRMDDALIWVRRAAESGTRPALETQACFEALADRPADAALVLAACAKSFGAEGSETQRALCALLKHPGPQQWTDLEKAESTRPLPNLAAYLTTVGIKLPESLFGETMRLRALIQRELLWRPGQKYKLDDLLSLARKTYGAPPDRAALRQELAPHLTVFLGQALLTELRATPPVRPEAQLDELSDLIGPLPLAGAVQVLARLEYRGATPAEMTLALTWLEPMLERREVPLAKELAASPDALRDALPLLGTTETTTSAMCGWVEYQWLQGQDEKARRMAAALVDPKVPRDLGRTLVLIGGSQKAAAAWLDSHGVPAARHAEWGLKGSVASEADVAFALRELRPGKEPPAILAPR